jgi:exodeoxyribonuclease V alpha subunit
MTQSQSSQQISKDRLNQLLASYRAKKAEEQNVKTNSEIVNTSSGSILDQITTTDKYGNQITYNDKQTKFISIASSGQSAVLIGAAGTGKTTCQKGVMQALISQGRAGILSAQGHKHLRDGTPGIVICAYTRRAVANIRKNVSLDMESNCITIHKLLEYQPVYYTVIDEMGDEKTKMKFEATRHAGNPLPSSIKTIVFEESSMLGTSLYQEVINACPHNPQLIFLGDIQQLPPVFGPAILGYKLLELPVIELTEVYRQALESPIISLAHRILSGIRLDKKDFDQFQIPGQLKIHPWKKKISADNALITTGQFFIQAEIHGTYNSEDDIILIPFNKSFGTDELNKIIANHLAKKRQASVYQIVAGFQKVHFSVGDKVLYDKEDATIISIERNIAYYGAKPVAHSPTLDYWGFDPEKHEAEETDVDFLLSQVATSESGDRVHQASHKIILRMNDSDQEISIDKASDINSLLLGYALTVHKAQGSEWRKVFFVTHQSHATMLSRELLYTAITRAREELYIICEPECFVNGILSQRIKGNTLEEKAEFFKGKVDSATGKLNGDNSR